MARSSAWSTKKLDFACIIFLNSMLGQSFHKSASREISSGDTHAFFEIAGADGVAFTDGTTIKAADERLPSGVLYAFDLRIESHGQGSPHPDDRHQLLMKPQTCWPIE